MVMLVSQSGATVEIIRCLERLRSSSCTPLVIGVTNTPNSPLAQEADLVLDTLAGPELHAPSKTYVNTVATLIVLYSYVVRDNPGYSKTVINLLSDVATNIGLSYDSWKSWGQKAADSWSDHRGAIQFLAMGPQMGSAWQASMLCSETAKVFSAVGDWATFRHGFEPQVDSPFMAVGFRPSGPETDVWRTTNRSIKDRGGRLFLSPELSGKTASDSRGPDFLLPDMISTIWETIPVHYFCIELAKHKKLDPSQIERKVTLDL
jgi:glucosamine--fructose-6-phosphate aminotransferase (isomerizing)